MMLAYLLRQRRRRRVAVDARPRQRGAALVEAALVTPIFVLFIFAIFEFGLLFRSYLTTTAASSEAARAASVASGGPTADYLVVQSMAHGLAPQNVENMVKMVVYHADAPDADVPAGCLTGPVTDVCNFYTSAAVELDYLKDDGTRTPHWGCGPNSVDIHFCPLDRDSSIEPPGPGYVGVYVETRHQYLTGFFGQEQVLTDTTVVRIEPGRPRLDLS